MRVERRGIRQLCQSVLPPYLRLKVVFMFPRFPIFLLLQDLKCVMLKLTKFVDTMLDACMSDLQQIPTVSFVIFFFCDEREET